MRGGEHGPKVRKKENRNITLRYPPRIPDLRWVTASEAIIGFSGSIVGVSEAMSRLLSFDPSR
jgi:hypothetical protein